MINLTLYTTPDRLADELAGQLEVELKLAGSLILPGGSSPVLLLESLAEKTIDWASLTLTTTDERIVPLDDPASNAGQIMRLLNARGISKRPFWLLEEGIEDKLPTPPDIAVIGFGLDGHFASLFPRAGWDASPSPIFEAEAPFDPKDRLTLSYEYLKSSRILHVLSPSGDKTDLLRTGSPHLPIKKLIEETGEKLHIHAVE